MPAVVELSIHSPDLRSGYGVPVDIAAALGLDFRGGWRERCVESGCQGKTGRSDLHQAHKAVRQRHLL